MRTPRTLLLALLLAVVALVAAGCGGSEVAADEVPARRPPSPCQSDEDLGGGGNADGAETANADSDERPATARPTTRRRRGDAHDRPRRHERRHDGAEPAPEDTSTNDTPPAGAEAEQFESFCEQNAGAC